MIFIEILQYTLSVIFGLLLGYQTLLSILAMKAHKNDVFPTERNRKFAILLPGSGEEGVLSRSLYSLSGLVYPKNLYDIFVINDSSFGSGAVMAQKLGARVLERPQDNHCANYWGIDQILQEDLGYDAIIVFDTDSLVSGNYLEVMNFYLEKGSKVIQGSDLILPQPGIWSVEAARIGFLLHNYARPLGRKTLGIGMRLQGNGMCFSTDTLQQVGWRNWNLKEDAEYGIVLQLEGVSIEFAPEAIVWTQITVGSTLLRSNRQGWRISSHNLFLRYAPELLMATIKKRTFRFFDIFLDLITPTFVRFMMFVMGMVVTSIVFWLFNLASVLFVGVWLAIAALGSVYLICGLLAAGVERQLFQSLHKISVYILWSGKTKSRVSPNNEQGIPKSKEPSDFLPD